jgi:hypothetical protein
MSFALGWEADEIQAGGLLYFDAITSWNRSFTGSVTKHPVDGGSSVTDSYIKNNPIFTMSAVVSGTDLSISTIALQTDTGDIPYNARPAPTEVLVSSDDQSLLMKFVPNVIGQFLPDTLPEVVVDEFRGDTTEEIQDILVNLQSGEGYNQITGQFETIIRPVNLYETNGLLTLIRKLPADNNSYLVITSINFREDTESGFCIYADITFEQIRFANLKKVQIPQDVVTAIKKKTASEQSKGRVDSTEVGEDGLPEQTDRDGLRTPYGDTVEKEQAQFQLGQPLNI